MIIKCPKKLAEALSSFGGVFAYDTETIGETPPGCVDAPKKKNALVLDRARMVVFSASGRDKSGKLVSVSAFVSEEYGEHGIARSALIRSIRPFFENPKIVKIAHNANYDGNVMRNHGVTVVNQTCTLIEGRCWNENLDGSLKDRAPLVGAMLRKTKMIDFSDIKATAAYAEDDARVTFLLWEYHRDSNDFAKENRWIYENQERPLIPVVQNMERHGMYIDRDYFKNLAMKVQKEKEDLEKEVYRVAGTVFNMNSPQQLADVLYRRLGIPSPGLKSATSKNPSTDEATLFKLRDHHPIISLLMEYRHISKLFTTYVNPDTGIVAYADADGYIHATFQQSGAVTFRFSCSLP